MDALSRRREMLVLSSGPPPTPEFYDKLVFDGTAYITTDIVPAANSSFAAYLGGETYVGLQVVFGMATGNTSIRVFLNSNTTETTRQFSAYYASSSASAANKSVAFSVSRYAMCLTPRKFIVYGSSGTFTGGSTAPTTPITIGNNQAGSAHSYSGEIETFRIYGSDAMEATSYSDLVNNYTPVATLRPCLFRGKAGLWCVETSKFYPNSANAGTLSVRNNT